MSASKVIDTLSAMEKLTLYVDGAARGNPGPAAIGYAIYDSSGKLIEEGAKRIGRRTNNEAEYEAILWGTQKVLDRSCDHLTVFSDSELVVRQVNGEYATKDDRMRILAEKVKAYRRLFEKFELRHTPRGNPRTVRVDALVNQALDEVSP